MILDIQEYEARPGVNMSTSFENSAMKSSFSLSSLRTGAAPPGSRFEPSLERPYHSLTKKRKEPCREAWRRSWGSAASGGSAGDDLWPLLQHHYDYIMDNQIIDTCKEANGELSLHNTHVLPRSPCSLSRQWSLNQLMAEFAELCQWLSQVQEEIYSSPENLTDRNVRVSRMAELVSVEPRRLKFEEQAAAILERIPEAREEVSWRVDHLRVKWEGVRLLLSPDQQRKDGEGDAVDGAHELRCLRRWLHCMEGRLPPPALAAARAASPRDLLRKLRDHQVLQRDVECHGRIVGSVVRLCGGDAARALERRWHLLYLRAIEWQCHLEACLARHHQGAQAAALSDSDEEPALKQPRLSRRGSPRRAPAPRSPPARAPHHAHRRAPSDGDSDDSYSEEEQEEYLIAYHNRSTSETELELAWFVDINMATQELNEQSVPGTGSTPVNDSPDTLCDQSVPSITILPQTTPEDCVDGCNAEKAQDVSMHEETSQLQTPPTVIRRRKPIDSSKFNQSNRKSKNCATFYFRHHDTDSDRQMMETDEKSQEESSEEEWTYVDGTKVVSEDSTDVMTSSVEIQCDLPIDDKTKFGEKPDANEATKSPGHPKIQTAKLESSTPDLLRVEQHSRCKENIERLVNQAEELVQKQAQQMGSGKKLKGPRTFKPLVFDDEGKTVTCRTKMSRIKEWLSQNSDGKVESTQCAESYDASGEYTTESEVDTSLTSEERNLHSSMDMSTSTCTVTPTHHPKVTLRKKRNSSSTRPWSVSCLSQLAYSLHGPTTVSGSSLNTTPTTGGYGRTSAMSISESALNMLASPMHNMVKVANSNSKLQSSTSSVKTAIQGHISSTNTINEACVSCNDISEFKLSSMRRKRLKLRRRQQAHLSGESIRHDQDSKKLVKRTDRLVKSLSFSGRLSPEIEDKHERSAASDPSSSRKHRFDTTSTSGNDSDEELFRQQLASIAHLRKSIEKTHISSTREESAIPEHADELVTPSFKLGPAGGPVRPRLAHSTERERSILALSLGDPNQLWDVTGDKDSDVDKSVHTVGTEEHSSFSEQAWDFYQEKYNSEPYSEAPDSDAARRLLEFGDDYRAFLDSQSDCCSSLSAHPDNEHSPSGTRRRRAPSEVSRERSLPRYRRPTRGSPVETPGRKPKKSMSSAERKKNLLDSLERSRNSASLESHEGARRKKTSESSDRKNGKRFSPSESFDLLNVQELSRRRYSSNWTSDEINSSLEYTEVNNRPDILDSLSRRRRTADNTGESELQKLQSLSELRRRSTGSVDSEDESSSPKKHSRRGDWDSGESDSESDEVRTLVRRSTTQLEITEALLARQESSPDLLRAFDYSDIIATCRENINCLEALLAGAAQGVSAFSAAQCREIRAVSARWSALRAAAARRGGARRLRRELGALRDALGEACEPDAPPLLHTKAHLHRRIEELKERLSRLLECKVSMLKLTVSVRRALGDMEVEGSGDGLSGDLAALLAAWDDAHQRTSSELLALEKALTAWSEWEAGLRELQSGLRSDRDVLDQLREKDLGEELPAQLKQLAASLVGDKKGGSCSDSLSDSGISDGDSEGAGRARRLSALRDLARRLQAALAPHSPAHRTIAKRMEQTEGEVRALQESCRALVQLSAPELTLEEDRKDQSPGSKTGSGDPEYSRHWVWRVLRSSLPIQLCLVALLLAAWLAERPRCCDALNSLAQSLTPQLRYVRGPPPV